MPAAEILTMERRDSSPIFGEVEQDEMTPVDFLEQDLQKLKQDNRYNYMVGCLCGDVVQEVIDICGADATAEAIDKLSTRKMPAGATPSLYWLVRSVAEVTQKDTIDGRQSIIYDVESKLMSNEAKYNRRIILGEVDNEELIFQFRAGYGQVGYIAKLSSVENAIKYLKRPDFVVAFGAVACKLAHLSAETSSIGSAIEAGGFDKRQFLDNLHANHGDMLRAYFANKHELEARRRELVCQACDELKNLKDEILVASDSDLQGFDYRPVYRLRNFIRRLGNPSFV